MQKIIATIALVINFSACFSQTVDSFSVDNWVNFNRSVIGETYGGHDKEKVYVTKQGDTLVRRLIVTSGYNEVQQEQSILHGQPNGLSISYYQNGAIAEIDYYLNGKLWNVISRADSNGKLYNPGTLRNGTGIRYFFSNFDREPNCYETYRDGLPEGAFYWQPTDERAVTGNLTYKKNLVNHIPAKKVTYAVAGGKVSTNIFDTAAFRNIFLTGDSALRILKLSSDSLEENPKEYKYIDQGFDDPAVVPRGTWRVVNPKKNVPIATVVFDDYGNPIKVTRYDLKGNIFSEKNFPSYTRRIW
jgi:antitoxin component YwqK of YwqJK toxin-antitoxin module